MKIFACLSNFFRKIVKRKSRRELEEELDNRRKEVFNLQTKLKERNETIKQLHIEIETLRCNKYQFVLEAYVLDASFCGCNNFKEEFNKIINSDKKIILTNITIQELKKITTRFSNRTSQHAREILDCALLYKQKFICQAITWKGSPDNSIIKFCVEYKSKVELLTCDKEMALLAEAEGVRVEYFKEPCKKTVCLKDVVKLSENGYITSFEAPDKFIMVRSQITGKKISSGEYKITPGDELYIICDKGYNYEFAHYRIPAQSTNIALLIDDETIWSKDEVRNLKRKDYVHFIQSYLSRKTQESS